jgi:hypothetical protein
MPEPSPATARPSPAPDKLSLWPPATVVLHVALLLVGLIVIAALADGSLALWLTAALVVAWAMTMRPDPGPREQWTPSERRALFWGPLIPLFIAIAIALAFFDGDWFVVALVAIAAPLVQLSRIALVLHWRRGIRP